MKAIGLACAAIAPTTVTPGSAAPTKPPSPVVTVAPLATGPGCITQSSFGTEGGKPGNFEVVVLQGTVLVHYWRQNGEPTLAWHRGQVISQSATGPGCIIQSDFGTESGHPGNLEVVVQEGDHVTHYFHDSSAPATPWVHGLSFGQGVTGGPSIIQSDFKSGAHGNFEVVVPEGSNLVHYWHDNSNMTPTWQRGQTIGIAATGGGTIIQSDFKSGGHGNFEVLVQEGDHVSHYSHDNANPGGRWQFNSTFGSGVTGAPSLVQSTFGASTGHGNFEVALRQGSRLVHWFKDNSSTANHWVQAQDIVTGVNSAGSLIQGTLGTDAGHLGNFEVVVLRENASLPQGTRLESRDTDFNLVHYYHKNDTPAAAWAPGQTVTYRGRSEKICQLTGSIDKETSEKTTNDTARFNLGATDLGYPVDDGTTLWLYFGDSRDAQGHGLPNEWAWDDAIGTSVDHVPPTPLSCLHMEVVTNPADNRSFDPLVVTQLEPTPPERRFFQGLFNVPASGFTVGGTAYTLFWTSHCAFLKPDDPNVCVGAAPDTDIRGTGRLTRRTGSAMFQELYALPPEFNYTASLNANNVPGIPADQNLGVYIWGIDRYRASYPTLAYVPAAGVESVQEWRFLTSVNDDGAPNWNRSSAGPPMFTDPSPGCIGEFSVSWVAPLEEWLMLYNCGGTIQARLARAPWGPWSGPTEIFKPDIDHAWCRYMHAENYPPCTDHLDGDNSIQTGLKDNGQPYAPYVLSRFTRATPQGARIIFLMSTWNPYQVVVMQTNLVSGR
jgi:hypothetical protein